jgi:hypothetical protein
MNRPRIRTLKPEVWQDERLAEVTFDARLLYVGLVTQADDEGRQNGNLNIVKSRIYPFDGGLALDDIAAWLGELEAAGLVELYAAEARQYIAIKSWFQDQRVDRPTPSEIPAPDSTLANPREQSRTVAKAPAGPGPGPGPGPDPPSSADAAEQERPEVVSLCHLLAKLILERDPKAKVKPDSAAWHDAARLLLDSDGRSADEVEHIIRWTQADPFWQCIVLSMPKLRERFTQLVARSRPAEHPADRQDRELADLARELWITDHFAEADSTLRDFIRIAVSRHLATGKRLEEIHPYLVWRHLSEDIRDELPAPPEPQEAAA